MGMGGQRHAPAALPLGKTRYPLYRRLGGPQGRSGRVRKISPPPGFEPRAVQPVASRYPDRGIPTNPRSYVLSYLLYIFRRENIRNLKISLPFDTILPRTLSVSRCLYKKLIPSQ
jgi:hypothetical protein